MRYARLNGDNEVEFVKEEIEVSKLISFDTLIDYGCECNIDNGFIMIRDGIVLASNEGIEIIVKF